MTQIRKQYAFAVFVILGLSLAAGTSFGATYYLRADVTTKTMPDGNVIPMWGFAADSAFGAHDGNVTVPGPQLVIPPGDSTLTINLENNLTEPVSIVIPGQIATMTPVKFTDDINRMRIRSFTSETEPNNSAAGVYTWTNLRAGTYMYQSGSHPAIQVQMGLYGPMKKDFATGVAYSGVAYDKDITLVFSEIDPAIHTAVAANDFGPGKSITSTIEYKPRYYLIDGNAFTPGNNIFDAGNASGRLLLRLINAGIETHVPVLNKLRGNVIAEDGYPYSYAPDQYSINLTAAKTKDLLVVPPADGGYAIYDRRLRLTNDINSPGGMLAYLVVGADNATFAISSVTATPSSILDTKTSQLMVNAADSLLLPLIYNWTVPAGAGSVSNPAIGNPVYTPPDVATTQVYTLTVEVSNGLSSATGTVDITVSNDLPPEINSVTAEPNSILDSQTSQLLVDANDDGGVSNLSYNWIVPAGAGTVSNAAIANPVYSPPDITGTHTYTLTVEVSDGLNTVSGTVSVTVTDALIFSANFNSSANGFVYRDNTFRGATASSYASGARVVGGVTGRALRVLLGGRNNTDINNMSGGWRKTFTLAADSNVILTFMYDLTQSPNYESDEFSDMMLSIDGTLYGTDTNDYIAKITGDGDGGPNITTGWQSFEVTLPLTAGSHTIIIGGYNNKKTDKNEQTTILIDNVLLVRN